MAGPQTRDHPPTSPYPARKLISQQKNGSPTVQPRIWWSPHNPAGDALSALEVRDGDLWAVAETASSRSGIDSESLAERAGISATGIAALEAGRRRAPRASTIALLLDALDLDHAARTELIAAAAATPDVHSSAARSAFESTPTTSRFGGNFPGVHRKFSFVDRPAELSQLHGAWHSKARALFVYGEAGAGKTRLVGEFAAGMQPQPVILWGHCTPDRLGSYEPFVEPIRSVIGRSGMAWPVEAELARLVPELATDHRWSKGPSRADPGVEQRLLFEAVARLLASVGPTLLVLEDLHWADAASLSLLSFLTMSPLLHTVVVIGTVRTNDLSAAQAGILSELGRNTRVERIHLVGLQGEDLESLMESVAGTLVSRQLLDTVAQATDGNPFFVEELTEHLLAHMGPNNNPPRVPQSVRETLGRRIQELSPDAQALIRAGAVLGRDFNVDLAGELAGLTDDRLQAACDDALLSTLITETSAIRMTFSHAIVQSAVYETTSARRRLHAHRRAAIALESATTAATTMEQTFITDAVVFDIARHWSVVAAADPGAASSAARWAMRSGDAAAAAADIDEAIGRYQQAATLWGVGTREHAETLIRLGRMVSALGRTEEADSYFRDALHLANALSSAPLFAQSAIGLAATVRYGHADPERIVALERSLDWLDPTELELRATAAAMLKRQLGFEVSDAAWLRRQWAARLVLDAVSQPTLSDDLLLSLGAARDSIVVDDPVVLGRVSRRIVVAASATRNLAVLANGWYGAAWSALELADGPAWGESVAAFATIADELRLPHELALAATMATTTALIEGRYSDAEMLSQRALSLATEVGDPNASAVHLTGAVLRGLDQGHAAEMVGLMEAMRGELAGVPTFMAGLAMTAALAGERGLAKQILDDQAALGFNHIRGDLEWLPVIGFYCHACSALNDTDHAPVLHHMLAASPARGIRVGPLAGWWGPTDFHLGALCRVMGRLHEAEVRLRSAVEVSRRLHAHPWLARSQFELARVLERRGRNGVEAGELRHAAITIVEGLGADGISV